MDVFDVCAGLPVALAIAAFKTCIKVGFTPQLRHGGSEVCSFADCGSKFEGTGFDRKQMAQIQVPVLIGGGSELGRWNGLSVRDGEDVALLEGGFKFASVRLEMEDRFETLGTSVIFAEDLNKPACIFCQL